MFCSLQSTNQSDTTLSNYHTARPKSVLAHGHSSELESSGNPSFIALIGRTEFLYQLLISRSAPNSFGVSTERCLLIFLIRASSAQQELRGWSSLSILGCRYRRAPQQQLLHCEAQGCEWVTSCRFSACFLRRHLCSHAPRRMRKSGPYLRPSMESCIRRHGCIPTRHKRLQLDTARLNRRTRMSS
jgi:hypothetical protein